ncbi:MAG: hypothetical protein SGCHY_002968 [Lobulomycetales sp.]
MHVKLILLVHGTFVRLVIMSANLVAYDWTILENTVYIQDFASHSHRSGKEPSPFLQEDSASHSHRSGKELSAFLQEDSASNSHRSGKEPSAFLQDLKNVLHHLEVPIDIIDSLDGFDFSSAKGHLVFARPGLFKGNDPEFPKLGLLGLSRAVSEIVDNDQRLEFEYLTSSLGSLKSEWIGHFVTCASGRLPKRTTSTDDQQDGKLKVVFPTLSYVSNSSLGPSKAGTITFQEKFWQKPVFPRQVMHQFVFRAGHRELSHSKIVSAIDSDSQRDIWVYVGSANCTESAWGSLALREKAAATSLRITNYELGIVFAADEMDCTRPYFRPLLRYERNDRPWSQSNFS